MFVLLFKWLVGRFRWPYRPFLITNIVDPDTCASLFIQSAGSGSRIKALKVHISLYKGKLKYLQKKKKFIHISAYFSVKNKGRKKF